MTRYIKLEKGTKAKDLIGLAYKLRATTPKDVLAAAGEALFVANPQLRGERTIPKGTIVLVPKVSKLQPAKATESFAAPLGEASRLGNRQIKALAEAPKTAVVDARARVQQTAKLAKSAQMRKLLAEVADDPTPLLADVVKAARADANRIAELERALGPTFEKMAADMKHLRKQNR